MPASVADAIAARRRLRITAAEIESLGLALRRLAVAGEDRPGKRSRLEPPEPSNHYERSPPGELIHIDVKKLGRFAVAGKAPSAAAAQAGALAGSVATSGSSTEHHWAPNEGTG